MRIHRMRTFAKVFFKAHGLNGPFRNRLGQQKIMALIEAKKPFLNTVAPHLRMPFQHHSNS